MGVILFGILSHLFCFLVIYVDAIPVDKNSQSLHVLPYIAMRSDGSTVCKDFEAKQWNSGFHGCFIGKKYADGGRNLNYIVDRILDHGEACMETSSLECRPDFQGFITLMNKTITQMKDYAEMYLEEIYKGRENIHDLECMEKVLSIKTYEDCFRDIVPQAYSLSNEHIQKAVEEGLVCSNSGKSGCSYEAKTSLNRIVRIIIGVEQPEEEQFEVEIEPTEASTTKAEEPVEEVTSVKPPTTKFEEPSTGESKDKIKTTESPTNKTEESNEWEEKEKPVKPHETNFEEPNNWEFEYENKPTEAPAQWMWYDYLAYPFVQAWKWISNLFG